MAKGLKSAVAIVLLMAGVFGCGGGGGESTPLSNDACATLGLPSKIVHGTACGNLQSSPVIRVLLVDADNKEAYCSGTMLTAESALTAAHCIAIADPVRVFIIYGEPLASAVLVEADSWQIHPNYHGVGTTLVADVALLHLSRAVPLPSLPVLTSKALGGGDVAAIFGYGQDENGNFDFEELKSGEMRISEVTETYIEADYSGEGSNTCLGDSGGPLVTRLNNQAVLAGVTSSGTQAACGSGDHSYFTNLQDPEVLSFLVEKVPGLRTL